MCDLFFQIQKSIEVCSQLDRYRLVRYSPLKINCRCPVCGDSEKSRIKARFWINEKSGTLLVGCFNCNYHSNFIQFCKDYYPDVYKELIIDKYKLSDHKNEDDLKIDNLNNLNSFNNSLKNVKIKEEISESVEKQDNSFQLFESIVFQNSVPVRNLFKSHFAFQYLVSRKIPLKYWEYFRFTDEWQKLVNSINKDSYKNPVKESRLIMLIKDFDGQLSQIQGRQFDKSSRNKYITIKKDDDANKIFGLDRVDLTKTVYLTEGIIDSLFIENSVQITGGQLDFSNIPIPKNNRVWVWDNEPYAKHTTQRIEKAVINGEKIVLFDNVNWKSKDINDLIVKEKISVDDINNYLNSNIISGLSAELRFKTWRKT